MAWPCWTQEIMWPSPSCSVYFIKSWSFPGNWVPAHPREGSCCCCFWIFGADPMIYSEIYGQLKVAVVLLNWSAWWESRSVFLWVCESFSSGHGTGGEHKTLMSCRWTARNTRRSGKNLREGICSVVECFRSELSVFLPVPICLVLSKTLENTLCCLAQSNIRNSDNLCRVVPTQIHPEIHCLFKRILAARTQHSLKHKPR